MAPRANPTKPIRANESLYAPAEQTKTKLVQYIAVHNLYFQWAPVHS